MSGASSILQHIRFVLETPEENNRDDAQLLDAFAGRRDQTAFALLVRRHGPLVFGVCRRLLGNAHEAEDAFQATFLVLARKAGAVRNRRRLPSWLYGVAYRLALKIRVRALQQRQREARAAAPQTVEAPNDDLSWNEVRAALDEELQRLPDRLRAPLILCYLSGKTHDEAAQHLGWSLSTFRRRLEHGRTLLRDRLTRRGLALSAALSTLLAQDALAAVPIALLASTAEGARTFAIARGLLTSPSATLAEEFMRTTSISRLKLLVSVLMAVGLCAWGVEFVVHRTLAAKEAAAADVEPAAEPPMPRRLLAVCPSSYFFANPVHHGGKALPRVLRQLSQLLGVPDDQSALLSDRSANPLAPTRENIKSTVGYFLDSDVEQHRLVLFFAGHAVELGNKAYLVPLDGELDKEGTLISLDWLYDRLAKCKARQKVLILDVCRYNPQRGAERGTIDKMGDLLDRMLREPPRGVEVLTACTAGEYSFENDSQGSLFLDQVSKLRDGGGLVDFEDDVARPLPLPELRRQLARQTQAAAKQMFDRDQTVRLAGTEANPRLGYDPKQRKPARPTLVAIPYDGTAALRGDALRVLQLAERMPPLLPSQRERQPRFDILPPFPRNVVARYQDDEKDSDLRAAIGQAVALLDKHAAAFQDTIPALPVNREQKNQFFNQLTQRQMTLALVYNDLEAKHEELMQLSEDIKREVPQMQASYLYVRAMLLYRMAYFYQYNAMLGKVRKEELPAFNPGLHKGYRLVPRVKMDDRDAEKIAEQAKQLLKLLAQNHKDTPWEFVARRELLTNLGLEWQAR